MEPSNPFEKALTRGQQTALLKAVDNGKDLDTYSDACRDGVSLRELDDLRMRGFLNEDMTLTDRGQDERMRMRSHAQLTHEQTAVVILALEMTKDRLESDGFGEIANDAYLHLALQLRSYMRGSESSSKQILSLMQACEQAKRQTMPGPLA